MRGFSLRGCFNFGDCFKSSGGGKLSKDEPNSPSDSRHGDVGSDGGSNSPTSPTPILPEPGSFFPSALNLENQNPEPIWIKPVMVEYPQSVNLTHYNVPVPIIEERNANEYTKIQSISVQNADEEMNELVKSHMDEFSKLMSLGEANASYETKLQTPMRKFDELPSNDNSEYEATGLKFTPIDGNNFPEDGVVLTMPTPIREEVLDKNSGDLPMHSPFPRVLQVNPVQQVFTPTYLPAGVSNENSDGSLSPIQPNFDMHNDPWGAEFEPPKEETYKDRIYSAFQGVDNNLHPQENNEGGKRSCYRRTPSDHIDLHPFSRVAEKKVVVDIHPTHPRFMTDEEYEKYKKREAEEKSKKNAESGDNDFFGNLLRGLMVNRTIDPQKLFDAISSGNFEGLFPAKPPSPVMIPQNTGSNVRQR